MLSRESASAVASSFLAFYYGEFVKTNEMSGLLDLYGQHSYITLADVDDTQPYASFGRRNIAQHLAKVDSLLSRRKVEIITADSVPLPDGAVQIICQGVMFLRAVRRVFLHIFVLVPTAYRTRTYHIASDYLRFVNVEEQMIPHGVVLLTPDQVAAHLKEENLRREQELQRQQLLEMQERIKQQQMDLQRQQRAAQEVAKATAAAIAAAEMIKRKQTEEMANHTMNDVSSLKKLNTRGG